MGPANAAVSLKRAMQPVNIFHRVVSHSLRPAEQPAWTKRGTWSRDGWNPQDRSFDDLSAGDLYQIGLGASEDSVLSFVSVPEVRRW